MTTLTEPQHAGAFIVSEASGFRSRSTANLPAGVTVRPAMVLARVTASGLTVQLAPTASDGSQNAYEIAVYGVTGGAAAAQVATIDTDAEVRAADLEWPVGITGPQKATAVAALLARGIKLR